MQHTMRKGSRNLADHGNLFYAAVDRGRSDGLVQTNVKGGRWHHLAL